MRLRRTAVRTAQLHACRLREAAPWLAGLALVGRQAALEPDAARAVHAPQGSPEHDSAEEHVEREHLELEHFEQEHSGQADFGLEDLGQEHFEMEHFAQEHFKRERFEPEHAEQGHLRQGPFVQEDLGQERFELKHFEQEHFEQRRSGLEDFGQERSEQERFEDGAASAGAGDGSDADADALREAEAAGLAGRLANLAGRPEAAGVPARRLLEALRAAGGLVNVAKRTLHATRALHAATECDRGAPAPGPEAPASLLGAPAGQGAEGDVREGQAPCCHYCHQPVRRLPRCEACEQAVYCSPQCRRGGGRRRGRAFSAREREHELPQGLPQGRPLEQALAGRSGLEEENSGEDFEDSEHQEFYLLIKRFMEGVAGEIFDRLEGSAFGVQDAFIELLVAYPELGEAFDTGEGALDLARALGGHRASRAVLDEAVKLGILVTCSVGPGGPRYRRPEPVVGPVARGPRGCEPADPSES